MPVGSFHELDAGGGAGVSELSDILGGFYVGRKGKEERVEIGCFLRKNQE